MTAVQDIPASKTTNRWSRRDIEKAVSEGVEKAVKTAGGRVDKGGPDATRTLGEEPSPELVGARLMFNDLVKNPPDHSIVMHLNGTLARALLDLNWKNRNLSDARVRKYKKDMLKPGGWKHTGQPIIVHESGFIGSGQHQLWALRRASEEKPDLSLKFDLRFGIPDESNKHLDTGKKRSGSDLYKTMDVPNPFVVSAAATFLYRYEQPLRMVKAQPDHDELEDLITNRYPELKKAGLRDRADLRKIGITGSVSAFCWILMARYDEMKAEKFFEILEDGLGFTGKTDPIYWLHRRLTQKDADPLDRVQTAALILKAWIYWLAGKEVKNLSWRPKGEVAEEFPLVPTKGQRLVLKRNKVYLIDPSDQTGAEKVLAE